MIKNKCGRILNTSSIGVKFGGGKKTFKVTIKTKLKTQTKNYVKKKQKEIHLRRVIR